MAVFDSPVTTYSDTTPHKRVITDVISILDPHDAPAINALGGLDGAAGKFRFVNGKSTVVEWLEDNLGPIADSMGATCASDATTITVTDASVFQPGHLILIDSEQCWVSSAATATNVLTVTRNIGGTQATHASNATINIIGMARLEGADSNPIALTDRYVGSNYTQILHKEIKVTRTHSQLSQYGISDEMSYQGDKVVPELMRLLERHFYYSTASNAGSATTPRRMGGIRAFVTNNTLSGASLAASQFENAVKLAYEDGGDGPWFALCSPNNYQKVKNFYDNSTYLQIERTETTVGMRITRIITPFGDVNLVLDRWATNTEIPLIDAKHAGFSTYYPFTQEALAKVGDYERSEVVGEYSLCVRQDKAHAILTAVS
jgi:hypothetical protein